MRRFQVDAPTARATRRGAGLPARLALAVAATLLPLMVLEAGFRIHHSRVYGALSDLGIGSRHSPPVVER